MTSASFNGKPDWEKLARGNVYLWAKDEDSFLWNECKQFAVDGIPGQVKEEEFEGVVTAFRLEQKKHRENDSWPPRSLATVSMLQRRNYKLSAVARAHGGDLFWEGNNGYKPARIPIIPGTERGESRDINERNNQYDNSFEESMDSSNYPMYSPVNAPLANTYSEEQYRQGNG
ncbi:hypothetical protein BOTNAR_0280g00020 [Botryotinia narcissicola]|uniref:Uncharacterized protein n=1 Tax=Botryotinia narcissicola TaxID=278944 RepID=A0A4Z1HY62_9HELO|nr:hypothetical protein BOTNAR_0280g00020 [Botryotinia narcissicola]